MTKTEIFIERARKVHSDRYDYSQTDYKLATIHIIVICRTHGQFWVSPHSHLKGSRCRRCVIDSFRRPKLVQASSPVDRRATFISKAQDLYGNLYDYSEVKYVNSQQKVSIICSKHGRFFMTPNSHLHKHSCPHCNKYRIPTHDEFISRVQSIHPTLDFSKVLYTKRNNKIMVICPIHGEYTTTPRCVLAGHGCRQCHTTALSRDEFIRRAIAIFHDKYSFDKVVYKNNQTKVIITCQDHGDFTTTPAAILDNHGCRRCYTDGRVYTTEQFVTQSQTVHGDWYDYASTHYMKSVEKVTIKCRRCQRKFYQLPGNHLQGAGCPYCGASASQCGIYDFVAKFGNVVFNDRSALMPYEIDCYLIDNHLGIEYNSLYWHSEGITNHTNQRLDKNRHQQKALLARERNITLLQFWEHEWIKHETLIKSMIAHRLGVSRARHHARQLLVRIESDDYARMFYTTAHLQGHRSAKLHLALGEQMLISFSSIATNRWEIIRMASRPDASVRGGAMKLFSHFVNHYQPHQVVTFADLRYSTGNVYKQLGFKDAGYTKPGYFYYKGDTILSRQKCQKHKLNKLLTNFDPDVSESLNMFNNGYRRVWDAGHLKFEFTLK